MARFRTTCAMGPPAFAQSPLSQYCPMMSMAFCMKTDGRDDRMADARMQTMMMATKPG